MVEFSFGEFGEVICDVRIGIGLENQAIPLYLEEMATMYDNGVDWENRTFRFNVHYDGEGGFEADGFTLTE